MNILSFESTCDETAVAVVRDGRMILTDQIFSQAKLHAVYGGVVPEIASRSHVEAISLLTERALEEAGLTRADIDAVAVSYAPGLIGAVLVGVNFAKAVASVLNVPLIPVHQYSRAHCSELSGVSRAGAALCLPCDLGWKHPDHRCAGLYGHAHSRRHPGRRGRGVL